MTQDDLKGWLTEANDCYVYREDQKEAGTSYVIRSNKDKKRMAVVFPPKNGVFRPASVCHICNQLNVPVPDFGQPMQEAVNEAKANAPKKEQ